MTELKFEATTILAVRRHGQVVIMGDGQVTLGNTIVKHSARKIRRLKQYPVLTGFAGSTADALALFERFESKMEKCQGQVLRAAVELAKDWRSDRFLRRLEAMLLVADTQQILTVSGNGDVLEADQDAMAIGSGSQQALAAAYALLRSETEISAQRIAEQAMQIASELCIYTNNKFSIEIL